MRDHDEAHPKKPQPIRVLKKGTNGFEAEEATPWYGTRKDVERDRHRHV
jgi:hypothetical protein